MNRELPIKSKRFLAVLAVIALLLAVAIAGFSRKGAKPALLVGTIHLEDGYLTVREAKDGELMQKPTVRLALHDDVCLNWRVKTS